MSLKVLMVGPARSVNGGVSAVVNNYYQIGLDKKIALAYLSTMEDGSKIRKLWVALRAVLRFLFMAPKYDIIHIHMASDVSIYRKMVFIQIASWYKKKIIIHQHGGNIEEFYYKQCNELKRNIIRRALQKAERMLVVAPYLKDFFSNIFDSDRIIVMPNSIQVPEKLEKNYSAQKVLFLGRLCKEKGINELLDAVQLLKQDFPNLQLYLGGVWVDEALHQKANQMGSWVHQLGWIGGAQKEQLLAECNIFVLPSYFEGLPVSLLEGMAYECACIGTDVGGISQALAAEKEGIVIPTQDVICLSASIRRYLENESLQACFGAAAQERIRKDFNLNTAVQKLLNIYHSI